MFSGLFYKFRKIAIQQSHIINPLLTSFARSVRKGMPSVFIAQTSLLRRSVCTKTSGNTFPYRPRTRLISPYYKRQKNLHSNYMQIYVSSDLACFSMRLYIYIHTYIIQLTLLGAFQWPINQVLCILFWPKLVIFTTIEILLPYLCLS